MRVTLTVVFIPVTPVHHVGIPAELDPQSHWVQERPEKDPLLAPSNAFFERIHVRRAADLLSSRGRQLVGSVRAIGIERAPAFNRVHPRSLRDMDMLVSGAEEGLEPGPGLFGDPRIRHDPEFLVQAELRARPQITLSLQYGDEAEPDRLRILLRGGRTALLRVVADNLLEALIRELCGSCRDSEG